MRSKQTLCVIEEPTLSFTELEAKRLFKSYGLTETQSSTALQQTRGRALLLDTMAQVLSEAENAMAAEQLIVLGQKLRKRPSSTARHSYGF
jgi:hypothetical protein